MRLSATPVTGRPRGWSRKHRVCGHFVLIILLSWSIIALPPAHAVHNQTLWTPVAGIDSYASPALIEHQDGKIHIVAVAYNGLVATASTNAPDSWTAWQIIGPAPPSGGGFFTNQAFYADPHTAPGLVKDNDTLYVITRGKDDNLYQAGKTGGAAWSDWQQLTTDGSVQGRLSVCVTTLADPVPPMADTSYLHVVYQGSNDTVVYRRFSILPGGWSASGVVEQLNNAAEGTIGTDGGERLLAVIRTTDSKVKIFRKLFPWVASWKERLSVLADGEQGDFFDISNVVFFGDAFHVAYAKKYRPDDISPAYAYSIDHLRVPIGQFNTVYQIGEYTPQEVSHAQTTLSSYRNKLVAAYTTPTGKVRYARWDNADSWEPWVDNYSVDETRRTDHRPALGVYDRRSVAPAPDYSTSNFGNELIAAITDRATDEVRAVTLSRAMLVKKVDSQFSLYTSNSDGLNPVCVNQSHPSAPSPVTDIALDGRPFYTELGFWLWTLPNWFDGSLYKQAGTIGCNAGNTSGRFEPPCSATKYPVIMRSGGGAFICSGVWVQEAEPYHWNIMHELTHAMNGMLGFSDDNSQPPTATNATQSNISLAALTSGFTLFGSQTDSDCLNNSATDGCPDTRATGFTGYGNNYDKSTRQHSFIGTLYYYFYDGDQLRDWIKEDLQSGSNLLQQKYGWVKTNLYKDKEFKKHSDPLNDRMPVPTAAETFLYPPTRFHKKNEAPSQAEPLALGSIAEGTSLLSMELGLLEFEAPVDLYVLILLPGIDLFSIKPDLTLQSISQGLAPWKTNFTREVHQSFFGDLNLSGFSGLGAFIGVGVTPTGDLSKSYLWVTSFVVP